MSAEAKDWAGLIGAGVLAVVALVLISVAGEVYGLGIALFIVAVGGGFYSIKRRFDRADAGPH